MVSDSIKHIDLYWPDGRFMQRMSREEYEDALSLAQAVRAAVEHQCAAAWADATVHTQIPPALANSSDCTCKLVRTQPSADPKPTDMASTDGLIVLRSAMPALHCVDCTYCTYCTSLYAVES